MSGVNRCVKISAVKHAIRKKRCKIKTIFGKMINLTLFFGIFKVKKLHFAHFICKFAAFLGYYTPFRTADSCRSGDSWAARQN